MAHVWCVDHNTILYVFLHICTHKYICTQSEKSRYYVMHKCICKLCVWVHKGKKKKKHDGIDSSFVCLSIGIDKIFDKIGNHMFLPAYTCQFSLPHHSFFFVFNVLKICYSIEKFSIRWFGLLTSNAVWSKW